MSGDSDGSLAEALEPPDMARTATAQGVQKTSYDSGRLLVLVALAGAYVALGGLFALIALAGASAIPHRLSQVLAGTVFALGLILVILGGAELFTSNMLLATALAQRQIRVHRLLRAWGYAYLRNFAGSILLAALVFFAAVHEQGQGAVGPVIQPAKSIAGSRRIPRRA